MRLFSNENVLKSLLKCGRRQRIKELITKSFHYSVQEVLVCSKAFLKEISFNWSKLFDYTWNPISLLLSLYSHWMSNFQPSSSASEGDMWLYALHDKYFPASDRLKVIDNVLVVWLPSLDVCKERKRQKRKQKNNFSTILYFLPLPFVVPLHKNQLFITLHSRLPLEKKRPTKKTTIYS